jgi:hypothetical protein
MLKYQIRLLQEQLTLEYARTGKVTPRVLRLSQVLDCLIVECLNDRRIERAIKKACLIA